MKFGIFTTVQKVACRWTTSENTVRRLIDEGKLSGFKVRGSYKITKESIAKYEQANEF